MKLKRVIIRVIRRHLDVCARLVQCTKLLPMEFLIVWLFCRSSRICIRSLDSEYCLCSIFVPGDRHVVVGCKVGSIVANSFLALFAAKGNQIHMFSCSFELISVPVCKVIQIADMHDNMINI